MELLQLKYFSAAAAQEHITKAAEQLHIAQPALTQSIRRLEEELGVRLFNRSGRNIVLNEAGKLFLKRIAPILAELDRIPEEIREAEGIFRRTIHMNVVAASALITKIIIQYKALHPQVEFQLMHSEKEESYDIGITTLPYGSKLVGKDTTTISEEIMLAVPADSKYARAGSADLKEVAGEDFISLAGSLPLREICDAFCISVGFVPHIAFESDSPEAVRDLIEASLGIAFWPSFSWGTARRKNIALIPIRSPECKRNLVVSLRSGRQSSAVLSDFYEYTVQGLLAVKNGADVISEARETPPR
mgnify:FL=1